jgi:N-acetylglutamate synthase-like GNAT family acetyltransferase
MMMPFEHESARPAAVAAPEIVPVAAGEFRLRRGEPGDVAGIFALVEANLREGHLLPRTHEDLHAHCGRFTVLVREGAVVACGELAPLSRKVAEVRSRVVAEECRGARLGGRLIDELRRRARVEGFSSLCAFTHGPTWFLRLGFSIVPHAWLPEKIAADCRHCPLFRRCGQHAVLMPIAASAASRHVA